MTVARPASPGTFRRFLLIGIGLVLVIVVATAAVIWMQRNDAIAAYRMGIGNFGSAMARQIAQPLGYVDRVLHEIEAQLKSAGETTSEPIGTAMGSQASLNLLVSQRKGAVVLTGLAIADADGVIRNSSGVWTFTSHNVANQDFFVHFGSQDDHESFVSAPAKSDVSGNWTAFVSRRLNDDRGGFAGVVFAEISLRAIEELYSGAMPEHRSVSLLRRDGTVLVRVPHREDEIGRKLADRSPWYAAVAQGGGAYHASDYFEPTKIVAFVSPLKNLPFVVQASVTEAEVLTDWPRQILWVMQGAFAAIIGVVLLLRYLIGQVERLERAGVLLAGKNRELETAHDQLNAALANISLGVCFYSGEDKLILSNQKYSDIYGLPPEATRPGTPLADVLDHIFASSRSPIGRDNFLASRLEMAATGRRQQAVIELTSGHTVLITHEPMPDGGRISTHEDITERCEAERNIRFLAHHDALTGLSNRALFTEKLAEAVARLHRHGEPFAVFMMDLDKFKNVNDTLGHPAGDQLLQQAAKRLQSSLRETDVLARFGGDEFAIIQSNEPDPREGAVKLANRIVKIISEPYDIDGTTVHVGASIGIALAPEHSDNSAGILKMADLALYEAKLPGSNGFRLFNQAMLSAADGRRDLAKPARVAISSAA